MGNTYLCHLEETNTGTGAVEITLEINRVTQRTNVIILTTNDSVLIATSNMIYQNDYHIYVGPVTFICIFSYEGGYGLLASLV